MIPTAISITPTISSTRSGERGSLLFTARSRAAAVLADVLREVLAGVLREVRFAEGALLLIFDEVLFFFAVLFDPLFFLSAI